MKQKKLMLLGGIRYLLPAIEAAHRHGCHVITVDYLPDNIAHKYSDEYHNVSILDKEAVLKLAKELQIDGILSFAVDPGVVTAAYVAEQMGLPFTCSYDTACIFQNKALFRQFLSEHGFHVPNAKGYNKEDDAYRDIDFFNWPVIVKPVDSAGSKGVSRVDNPNHLKDAINNALKESHNGNFIIEDFLVLDGYQSSADCFSIDGKLVYVDFSDQLFDQKAANPYTPSLEIWPSTMKQEHQDEFASELQRLLSLLNCKTGLFNVETRICSNGLPYIMEVSPRAGGNRIAELQHIGTGVDLIEAEVCKAIGASLPVIHNAQYSACYVNNIVHSLKSGIFGGIEYDEAFKKKYVVNEVIYQENESRVESFKGANNAIGSVFLRFRDRQECNRYLPILSDYIHIRID